MGFVSVVLSNLTYWVQLFLSLVHTLEGTSAAGLCGVVVDAAVFTPPYEVVFQFSLVQVCPIGFLCGFLLGSAGERALLFCLNFISRR